MDEIDTNIQAFDELKNELEKSQSGEWALVHDEKLVGVYPTFEEAASLASKQFEQGTYLIRQIGSDSLTLPVSVMVRR